MQTVKRSLLILFLITSCKKEADFFINGKGYYTQIKCLKDTSYVQFCYHLGYNFYSRKYEYHWGNDFKHKCLNSATDTIAWHD